MRKNNRQKNQKQDKWYKRGVNGEPLKAWIDSTQHICIEYESGKFWHYSDEGEVLSWN